MQQSFDLPDEPNRCGDCKLHETILCGRHRVMNPKSFGWRDVKAEDRACVTMFKAKEKP